MYQKWIDLLGQRLAVGFDGYEIPQELRQLAEEYRIGNVILFRRNVHDREQLRKLCSDLTALILRCTGQPPLIMMDEECGSVSRLAAITGATPSAMAIGAAGDLSLARETGRLIGRELRSLGINMNLAPVLDVMINPRNRVIGNRAFGSDPMTVSRMACSYMEGLRSAGILACGKHFPGHGDTGVDSHVGLPCIEKSEDAIRRVELAPFRAAIAQGIPAIMSAHVVFPAFEPAHCPATVSRRVMTGLLR